MNTAQPVDLITEGVVETPLTTAEQLQPGVIISGVGAQHAWMVLMSDQPEEAGWIKLKHLMKGVRQHTHVWTARGEGAADCSACGLRRQRIADLLPVTSPRARVIIPPANVLNALNKYTVYATTSGQLVTVSGRRSERSWSTVLPIVPMLHPVWQLPDALVRLVSDAPAGIAALDHNF